MKLVFKNKTLIKKTKPQQNDSIVKYNKKHITIKLIQNIKKSYIQ